MYVMCLSEQSKCIGSCFCNCGFMEVLTQKHTQKTHFAHQFPHRRPFLCNQQTVEKQLNTMLAFARSLNCICDFFPNSSLSVPLLRCASAERQICHLSTLVPSRAPASSIAAGCWQMFSQILLMRHCSHAITKKIL